MFTINLRRLYYVCDKVIIRNLRGRRLEMGPNPGLDKRLQAFKEEGLKVEDNDAEEFIEQSDSSFYNVGRAYGEHLNETLIGKHELRHHIIKEKYFKEYTPNLLTWSEKEQIRHLASTHPDEWTPEKIAESFPVTVAVVKKLLKFPWKPASEQRIARHDASAMRNWKELKEGSLDIPKELREHFLKFSERTIPPLNRKSIKEDMTQEEKLGEFAKIIQRCAKKSENKSGTINTDENEEDNDIDTKESKVKVKRDTKRVTLDQLTNKIKKRIECGTEVNLPDKIMLDTVSVMPTHQSEINMTKEVELFNDNSENGKGTQLTQFKEDNNKLFAGGNYPERIRIPKKAFKKGATYKVNDCFYDDDGRFLYRVIGMTKD
ncbi:uncharacterized protein [Epargyreus clarus]|uniref:uncharacterized protein n=1 Tax=Epargyreus clarus TaxID=520877 RepID=UPI003C2C25B2